MTRTPADRPLKLRWRVWLPHRRFRIVGIVDAADLVPDRLPRRGVVVVEDSFGPSWVGFDCPCPRRHRLMVRLSQGAPSGWRLSHDRFVSLEPSIDCQEDGIRCHFWLQNGRVRWV